ncbi:SIR2 family NAD-dependent protein deacylase [Burkholderia glumae]|uniref:protein acetyllysine N-acetyltransferase n=2 Tax=Burkholderia glumae TaxID=337 RepID=A0AAP9XW83_BURGL|nr:Sir2 family NAD-dependent protein deacetylase [Burkholderia glumae]ACR31833.1 NAD-dependent deacetylase [Burkholderia glumae BGR1]KHJ61929.1 NAD-dependent deacetylase [Burkholderia glumae]MCM2484989.1 NAD-dependent deacetylase [Burkholderia glumae]MCM2495342.1 NAD-dependent deacetylase [Burkholderia glumae]MCM2510682.1 NAD-dependent deacetylase [Burkholderia glumae]
MMSSVSHGRPPRLYVFSGAGLSAESGIPTFRTGDGIWSSANLDKVCNFLTWRRNREAVFAFYNARIAEKREARPNDAHRMLAAWQEAWGTERVRLVTQNIDDLLERAGARQVVHLHGDVHSLLCTACDCRFPKDGEHYRLDTACPACGDVESVKPGVVFFNEAAPEYVTLHRMQLEMTERDLFVAIGTAFQVVGPESLLPRERRLRHARNFLVDPQPSRPECFGHVEAVSASVGLRNLQARIEALMAE